MPRPDASIQNYRTAQARLQAAFAAMGLARLCASCPDPCCARVSFAQLLVPADLAVLPADALPTVQDVSVACCHLAASGCDLPHDRRPWLCVSHMCERWSARMTTAQALRLQRLFTDLDVAHDAVDAGVRQVKLGR